jgi:outer membrane protein TolC
LSQTQTQPSLNVTVPLLRVWRDNPSAADLKAARIALDSSRLNRAWETQRVVQNAVVAFWNALAARIRLEILVAVGQQADEVGAYLKELVNRGQLALSEYQRAAANSLYRTLEMDNARQDYEAARSALAVALGIDPNNGEENPVPAGQFPEVPSAQDSAALDDESIVRLALDSRPDLMALNSVSRAEGIRLKGAQNNTVPKLDLDLRLDRVFLRYEMSLGNNTAEGRVLERRAAAGEARLNADVLKRRIVAEVRRALQKLRLSQRAYYTAGEATRLLEMVASDVNRRTKLGVASPQDRLAIFERVGDAKRRFLRAAHDYAASIAELRLATSSIPIETAPAPQGVARAFLSPPAAHAR